jgi:hypothetical protein
MRGKTNRPKGLFRARPRPQPDLDRLLDTMAAGRPTLRNALREAFQALETADVREILATIGETDRAALTLAWRDAGVHLASCRQCDSCPAVATRIRCVVVGPRDDFRGVHRPDKRAGLTGFLVLCPACAKRTRAELKTELLDKYARLQREHSGPLPHRRGVIVGAAVGEVEHLAPGRHYLLSCAECRRPIWGDDQDELDLADDPVGLCLSCTAAALKAGRLELVPTSAML